jgi:hypothetical protein
MIYLEHTSHVYVQGSQGHSLEADAVNGGLVSVPEAYLRLHGNINFSHVAVLGSQHFGHRIQLTAVSVRSDERDCLIGKEGHQVSNIDRDYNLFIGVLVNFAGR